MWADVCCKGVLTTEDLKCVFSYLRPYRRDLIFAILLLVVEGVFEMLIPLLMTGIVDVGVPEHDIGLLLRKKKFCFFITA